MRTVFFIAIFSIVVISYGVDSPPAFYDIPWGTPPDSVRLMTKGQGWNVDKVGSEFPQDLNITVYNTDVTIAGYSASIRYYFWENKLFQSTVVFDFKDLTSYDFNYNVYRSVSEYYTFIRSNTLTFVFDIYDLLAKKYGKKEPVFKGLDPRFTFVRLDALVKQERWNFRYHPYDFYQMIATSSYARWDFPGTRVIFSVNISAADKRFDYSLSAASLDMVEEVTIKRDQLRMSGL
jgi:hypothetical protein